MYLSNITLNSFRNFNKIFLEFGKGLNFITGENSQGKSNLIEAIYLMLTFKSLKTNYYEDIISFQSNYFYLKGLLIIKDKKQIIEVVGERDKGKRLRINNKIQINPDYLTNRFPAVIFTPENYNIIKGMPSCRRSYINFQISQINQQYFNNLKQYRKVLIQKNMILQERAVSKNTDLLDSWDQQLMEYGAELIVKRNSVIKEINNLMKKIYKNIISYEEINMVYKTFLPDSAISDKNEIISIWKKMMIKSRNEEIKKGFSLYGPHRDEICFSMNGKEVKDFSSQGQMKSVLLALNLAEIQYIYGELGEYPIVLFDELISELDKKRIDKILNALPENIQIFITGVDGSKISARNGEWFQIKNGMINKIN